MKYKVQRTVGCLATGRVIINGRDEYDMSLEEVKQFAADVLERLRSDLENGTMNLANLVEAVREYDIEYSDECEQCGDSMVTTKWEI